MTEVQSIRNQRLKLPTISALDDRYLAELERLMGDPNPFVRLKAMDQLRKTIGLDQGGIYVETQVNVVASAERSFEGLLSQVRAAQELSEPSRISEPNALSPHISPIFVKS